MIYPTPLPIYLRLHHCEPRVAENGFVLSEIGEEKLEWDGSGPHSDVQDGVMAEVSTSVFCSVNVKQLSGFWKLFDREF